MVVESPDTNFSVLEIWDLADKILEVRPLDSFLRGLIAFSRSLICLVIVAMSSSILVALAKPPTPRREKIIIKKVNMVENLRRRGDTN